MRGTTALMALLLAGCGEDPVEGADFSLACAAVEGAGGCGSTLCTVTPLGSFHGVVALSRTEDPGLRTVGLPISIEVEDAAVTLPLGFSADPAIATTGDVQLTATAGDLSHAVTLGVSLNPVAPSPRPGDMMLYGCAGMGGLVVGPPPLAEVFVGAWRNGFDGDACTQDLSEPDGTYQLVVLASCGFTAGADVFVTAGGFDACTRPFQPGAVQFHDAVPLNCD